MSRSLWQFCRGLSAGLLVGYVSGVHGALLGVLGALVIELFLTLAHFLAYPKK